MPPSADFPSIPVVRRPRPAMLAGIVHAAAQMAQADGKADAVEQEALLRFLREHELLQHFGRRACLDAYRAELAREPSIDEPATPPHNEDFRMVAPLIASAAASIAQADGTVHPAELRLLSRLAERLALLSEADAVISLLFCP